MINPIGPIGGVNFRNYIEKTETSLVKYCFVDFDETLRHATPEGYAVGTPEEIEVYPWAVERLKEAKKQGYFIVGITNQNYYSRTKGAEFVKMMCDATLEKLGMKFPVLFSQTPQQSKPNPWMLEQAETKFGKANKRLSVMVGDRPEKDGKAAENFGIRYVHVDEWRGKGLP